MKIRRGDVWWVNFDPSVGSEIQKLRPAVVVSNDRSNSALSRFQVIPFSTQVARVYPSELLIEFAGKRSKIMVDQITTASMARFSKRMGALASDTMAELDTKLRLQLGL